MNIYCEYHRAGVITRTVIPTFSSLSFPSYPTIHYRSLIQPLLTSLQNATPSQPVTEWLQPQAEENCEQKKRTTPSRYDNIIERLEKKYCGSLDTLPCSGDDSADENTRPQKRKARAQADYYDMDDCFIDDSDNIAAFEIAEQSKRRQTKYSGFFVSSGELEISENVLGSQPVKDINPRRDASPTLAFSEEVGDTEKARGMSPSELKTAKPSDSETVPEKDWRAPLVIQEAMREFTNLVQDHVATKGATLKIFPASLDGALDALDQAVLAQGSHCDSSIHRVKSSKYLSVLNMALGGEISRAAIKSAVTRSRGAHEASRLAQELESDIVSLASAIRKHVQEAPPPPVEKTSLEQAATSIVDVSAESSSAAPGMSVLPAAAPPSEQLGPALPELAVAADNSDRPEMAVAVPLPPLPTKPQWQWVCRWNMVLRGRVCDVEELCLRWVDAENAYRSNLKAAHKKNMDESQTKLLSPIHEVSNALTKLADLAFASPYDSGVDKGGLGGIKKAISTEKHRRKSKDKRGLTKGAITGTGPSAENTDTKSGSVSAEGNVETTKKKPTRKKLKPATSEPVPPLYVSTSVPDDGSQEPASSSDP